MTDKLDSGVDGLADNVVLNELQLLLSMYTHKSQVRFDDPELSDLIDQYLVAGSVEGLDNSALLDLNRALNYSISFSIRPQDDMEVNVRIPTGYPQTEKISASCSSRLKDGEYLSTLNAKLRSVIQDSTKGEAGYCDILSVINYCQSYLEDQPSASDSPAASTRKYQAPSTLARIWIYSHHIYNKKKRKFLVDTASQLSLNGFSMPGKPGFIYVEGDTDACEDYWARVRQLSWQKISLITKQNLCNSSDLKFNSFEELSLTKSDFIKYLDEKELAYVIKEYLNF